LLRVLEQGEFIKVGSSKVLKTDVRVVAATNVALIEAVKKGKFRNDLYYRLSTVPIYVPPLRQRGSDIELLFRKFAADFSDKYKTKPVQLTSESREILLEFQFPGNIRQLKNIVEQISVLEEERTISGATISRYLPKEESRYPVLYNGSKEESLSEREILYKVLFDLKNDVHDLKRLVRDIMNHSEPDKSKLLEMNKHLFETKDVSEKSASSMQESTPSYVVDVRPTEEPPSRNQVQDISHELEEDNSLSLEKKEKEMIIKALRKNNNKRKYAAQDLGISERTLYRKIKQYEIDD